MKKLHALTTVFCFFALSVLTFATPYNSMARSLSFACHHGPTDVHAKLLEDWIKEVETISAGDLKIDFYPGQALVKAPQTIDGIDGGMVDIGFSILQYTRGRFPLMDFINLPLGFPSGPVNTAIINEVAEKFAPKELNVAKFLYFTSHGPGYIHTNSREVKTMEDLKGLKIRSNGPTADMIKALGGTPTALPMPELYQALQKGVVQGGLWDFSASADWKLAEVSKYSIIAHSTAYSLGFFVAVNKDVWASLSPELQGKIEALSPVWAAKHGQAWAGADERGIAAEKAAGNNLLELSPEQDAKWRETVQPVIDTYIQNCESKGLPGKDVIAYVEQRLKDAKEGTFESKFMSK